MSRLTKRLHDLEQRLDPPAPAVWVRIFQYEGQSYDDAVAAWEAEHGPVADRNVVLRVIINKPFAADGQSTRAVCPL